MVHWSLPLEEQPALRVHLQKRTTKYQRAPIKFFVEEFLWKLLEDQNFWKVNVISGPLVDVWMPDLLGLFVHNAEMNSLFMRTLFRQGIPLVLYIIVNTTNVNYV
jgi:hypothetical protein